MRRHLSIIIGALILSNCLLFSQPIQARDASCNYPAGQLVFNDTLYGVAIGTIMGGLAFLASERGDEYRQPLATGALAGATVGLGFGGYEVAKRDCKLLIGEQDLPKKPAQSLSLAPAASRDGATAVHLSWSLRF